MRVLSTIAISFVAVSHFGFLVLEMFLWDHPIGRNIFAMTPEYSASTADLAANQGLYNGFLAIGLVWGLITKKRDVVIFFLLCVIVAGVFGAMTAKSSILYIQALPAAVALIVTLVAKAR